MTIISSKSEDVAKAIGEQVGRGLTILNGHGYYTREQKMSCTWSSVRRKCQEQSALLSVLMIMHF